MTFANLKIGTRLGAAFAIMLLLLLSVSLLGVSRMAAIRQAMVTVTQANNLEESKASAMRFTVADRMIALRNMLLLNTPEETRIQTERLDNQARAYEDARTVLQQTFATYGIIDEEKALLAQLTADQAAAEPLMARVLALNAAGQTPEAVQLLTGELRAVQQKWNADLASLEKSEQRQSAEANAATDASYAFARSLILGLTALAVVFGVALAWFITRSIVQPIRRAVAIAQTVAAGDLSSRIESGARDETGALLAALKSMNDGLGLIVGQVRAGTDTMLTAAQEIAAGNQDLSSRTEEQAGSLEETASSMEELTGTVRQNADNARQAHVLAQTASEIAGKGGAAVAQVVDTMSAINASSHRIAEIISVIDGIAFQTNILALNAAVEAARAGEQGRGFAVVATEVRNLAHRSAAAAKEIKELIDDSVDKVDAGTRQVDAAGRTMNEVVDSVRRVSDVITEITEAGREQAMGIEQVNQAIIQMDGVTQQNAALVEQAAAAADSLQGQAAGLAQLVSRFVLVRQAPLPARKAGAPIRAVAPRRLALG
jgi:methyl-accepting chemotaxis protein